MASQQAQLVQVLWYERVRQWQGEGNLWAECSPCLLELLCALFSSSHLSPRDVQPSALCWSLAFAREVLGFIPGKKWAWRRGEVLWYCVMDVLLLLCLSGWCWRLLEIVELLEQSQHWAIPTWNVGPEHSGVKQLGWVYKGLGLWCYLWHLLTQCPAQGLLLCPCMACTCSSSCRSLQKSGQLPLAPLLSKDNLWAKCASQNPADLPVCPSLRVAAPVGPRHSTVMGFSLWQGKTTREKTLFLC